MIIHYLLIEEAVISLLHILRVKNWEIHHPLKNTLSPGDRIPALLALVAEIPSVCRSVTLMIHVKIAATTQDTSLTERKSVDMI